MPSRYRSDAVKRRMAVHVSLTFIAFLALLSVTIFVQVKFASQNTVPHVASIFLGLVALFFLGVKMLYSTHYSDRFDVEKNATDISLTATTAFFSLLTAQYFLATQVIFPGTEELLSQLGLQTQEATSAPRSVEASKASLWRLALLAALITAVCGLLSFGAKRLRDGGATGGWSSAAKLISTLVCCALGSATFAAYEASILLKASQ